MGKRSDGLTLVPWKSGQCLTWMTLWWTPSHRLPFRPHRPRLGVQLRQHLRESFLNTSSSAKHIFNPVALKTMGPIHTESLQFLYKLGDRLISISGNHTLSSSCFNGLSLQRWTSKFSQSKLVFNLSF